MKAATVDHVSSNMWHSVLPGSLSQQSTWCI